LAAPLRAAPGRRPAPRRVPLLGGPPRGRALWWLHPVFPLSALGIPLLVVAFFVPEATYQTLFRTDKHVDRAFVEMAVLVYAGFVVGALLPGLWGGRTRPRAGGERDVIMYSRWLVWPLFAFTMFGYAAWLANAVLRAGLGGTLNALADVLLRPSGATSAHAKYTVFENVPGITTFTQFGILYATLEAILWARGGSSKRLALLRFGALVSLTLVRALLLSERLALVEVVVPVVVVLAAEAWARGRRRVLLQTAPLYFGAAVFGLFALAEYFRSWDFYRPQYGGSYLSFAADRFFGYYVTALNNAAVVYHYAAPSPLRHTFRAFFEMPVVGSVFDSLYGSFIGEHAEFRRLLVTYANPEFNNVPPVGLLLNEYSLLAPLAAVLIGLVSTVLYRGFVGGRLYATLLYPSWFVGLLEISRVYYWTGQRYFPVLAFVAFSLVLFAMSKVPAKGAAPARPRTAGGPAAGPRP